MQQMYINRNIKEKQTSHSLTIQLNIGHKNQRRHKNKINFEAFPLIVMIHSSEPYLNFEFCHLVSTQISGKCNKNINQFPSLNK